MQIAHYVVRDAVVRGEDGVSHTVRRKTHSGSTTLVHESETYQVDDSGYFDVPEEVGRALVRRSGWYERDDTDGLVTPEAFAEKSDRVAQLEALVESLSAQVDKLVSAQKPPTKPAQKPAA